VAVINMIEILSVLAFVATVIFLYRRNLLKVPRFVKPEMNGWPKLDGNIILYLEIVLLIGVFCMNVGDQALHLQQTGTTYPFVLSGMFAHIFYGLPSALLSIMERFGWWLHILTVFAFLNYLPYSKHLHVMLAFPNTYFADLEVKGKMTNMPEITKEIKLMMDPNAPMEEAPAEGETQSKFGAKDVEDYPWTTLLAAYTCTECGRCTAACPANTTGKVLSPRAIVMAVRDRMEDKSKNEKEHGKDHEDGKSLFDYITKEEINACTTCNACAEECPININPLSMILELRRYKIMEEADSSEEWNLMFTNTENNGAVWQFNPADRAKWVNDLKDENA